jgi:hypothetical protein
MKGESDCTPVKVHSEERVVLSLLSRNAVYRESQPRKEEID